MELEFVCEKCKKPQIIVLSKEQGELYKSFVYGETKFNEFIACLEPQEKQMLISNICSNCEYHEKKD